MGKSNFVIDSSVLIALYNSDDIQHTHAISVFQKFPGHLLIFHPYVVQEVATVLTYRVGLDKAQKFLSDIPSSENVFMPVVDVVGDIEYFKKLNKKISFTDSALIRLAREMNAELITFDRQMISVLKRS